MPTTDAAARSPYAAASWRALGTYVQLVVGRAALLDDARATAERLLDRMDRACSRFRSDSDLNRASDAAGRWTEVDPLLAEALQAAVEVAESTGGLVDPTLGAALAAQGYDRDLDEVRDSPVGIPEVVTPRQDAWREMRTDPAGRVLVPEGVRLDLGATGKAFASDRIARAVERDVGVDCVVSLGGDVAVGAVLPGTTPRPWPVTVAERPGDPPQCLVRLVAGGMATSTVTARRWDTGAGPAHHLLDPATGRPVEAVWRTVSVVAGSCLAANAASTAAVVLGPGAPGWLAGRGLGARLVATDGSVEHVGPWPDEEVPR